MNAVTVQQTTQGLHSYLAAQQAAGWDLRCGSQSPNLASAATSLDNGVVIGFDARVNSRRFEGSKGWGW